MKPLFSTAYAAALAACLTTLCAASVAPARASAAELKIDPHILSAAPFEFRADHAIFSNVKGATPDSRIFMQPKPLPLPDDLHFSTARPKAQVLA